MKKRIVSALLFCMLVLSACALPTLNSPAQTTVSATATASPHTVSDEPDPAPAPTAADVTAPPPEMPCPDTTAQPAPLTTSAPETTVQPYETTVLPETTPTSETTTAAEPLDLSRTIFLTFDDGPSRGKTEEVLRILNDYSIRATFFTVGMFVDYYPELTRQIADAGHTLACHSYSHDYGRLYTTPEAILDDLANWERAVTDATGSLPEAKLYRFPGGTTGNTLSSHEDYHALLAAVTDAGYTPFDWTVATNDRYLAGKREEQTMEEYFFESLAFTLSLTNRTPAPPKILIMHDTSADTVATLPAILDYLIDQGYTFATLDALDEAYIANKKSVSPEAVTK